jgi:hypothetical protein
MTKDALIAFISEKARISTERAELAYQAFWEAILSELKTGHFSLPFGAGSITLKEKPGSQIKQAIKEIEKASAKLSVKKSAAKPAPPRKPAGKAPAKNAKKAAPPKAKSKAKKKK